MSSREARSLLYNQVRDLAMAQQQQQQAPAAQQGAIDPQMQLGMYSFTASLANLPVFQKAAPQVTRQPPPQQTQPVFFIG
jgi:hypothetical protein